MQEHELLTQKPKPKKKTRGNVLAFHFPQNSQWSDDSLTQGTVKGETNRFSLPGADPEADGSEGSLYAKCDQSS